MRRADIFLLISGVFYTLERCAGIISDWYGPDCALKNLFMWVFLALALFEYGKLLYARRKKSGPDTPKANPEP